MSQPTANETPVASALKGRCPRCGEGKLFKKFLELQPKCTACGLDYKFIDTGDGPAVFAIFILGFVALGGAVVMNIVYGIDLWITYAFWGIALPLLALALLRVLKALLIALQYRHKAEEGRLARD